jgi:pilus assembly protein CpaE
MLTRPALSKGTAPRIGVVQGALGDGGQLAASMSALFPQVVFEALEPALGLQETFSLGFDVVVAPAQRETVETLCRHLRDVGPGGKVIVVLRDADVQTTRRLMQEGAADVLPHPVTEPALALSLERLLASQPNRPDDGGKSGEVVSILKAGGGVGATSIAAQTGAILAERRDGLVCLADLDIQFGAAGVYLDMTEAVTIADLLQSGASLTEAPLSTALGAHRSGLRLLGAPRDLMPMEALSASHAGDLVKGLRRDFALTLVDLPSVWTAWTHRVLSASDRIVLVTHLSVPHVQLVKRQLHMLAAQKLDDRPLTLVCNAPSAAQAASLPLKTAERAIGRPFDVIVPLDERHMTAATNQGVALSDIRRGAKAEKALVQLADTVSAGVIAAPAPAARKWL